MFNRLQRFRLTNPDGPRLLPSQETDVDIMRRLKLTPEQFTAAKLTGLPDGSLLTYSDPMFLSPRQIKVRLKTEVDEWRDRVLALAKALK
jgi:hypothetical protein